MPQTILSRSVPAQTPSATQNLTLAALGVVYGDIGTSPLYAVRQSLVDFGHVSHAAVFGALSLIVWSLVLVVTVKYVLVIMRADNRGEGGLLALTALVLRTTHRGQRRYLWIMAAGLVGAALFYGDGVITPAISVLSAVEGLKVATPFFEPYVIPISLALLVGLFLVQRRGTAAVGGLFGPVMLVWFAVLALLGLWGIVQQPRILLALNPHVRHRRADRGAVARLPDAGRGVSRGDRGRDALCRYGAFRPPRPAPRLALAGLPGAGAELFRAGRVALQRPGGTREPVLQAGPRMGSLPARDSGLGRDDHRLASGDFRRFLDHPPGDPARLPAASRGAPHLRDRDRPGLCAAHQLGAPGRDHRAGARLPDLGQSGRGLWHRGQRHDADHHRARLPLHAQPGLEPRHRGAAVWRSSASSI